MMASASEGLFLRNARLLEMSPEVTEGFGDIRLVTNLLINLVDLMLRSILERHRA